MKEQNIMLSFICTYVGTCDCHVRFKKTCTLRGQSEMIKTQARQKLHLSQLFLPCKSNLINLI